MKKNTKTIHFNTWFGRNMIKSIFLALALFVLSLTLSKNAVYASNRWVATGNGTNSIAYSDDGINWTGLGTSIFSNNAYGVAWNGTYFVAVGAGTSNTIAYSSDGINWTGLGKTIFSSQGFGVAWNGTYFVATGMGTNTLAYSSDGINWTGLGTSIFSPYGFGIAWNGTGFVASGAGTNGLAYSDDGINWTGLGTSVINDGRAIAWNGTYFVVGGNATGINTLAYSSDGINWTGLGENIFSTISYGVAWNGTYFVATGQGTNTLAYSSDGINWTGLGMSIFSSNGRGIAWNGTYFVATGEGTNTLAYSSDGINWTGLGTSIFSIRGQDVASAPAPNLIPAQDEYISQADHITITSPNRSVSGDSSTATISITDESGIPFYIPYIQTSTTLDVAATIGSGLLPSGGGVKFVLNEGLQTEQTSYDLSSPFIASFANLSKGTYTLDVYIVDSSMVVQTGTGTHDQATNIGVGDIITAIGDSITMGHNGSNYGTSAIGNWLNAPAGSFSTDNRNYPQYGPQGGKYYKSFLTELNDSLSSYYGYPVFIMNEGWGGYKTSDYVALMATQQWEDRQTSLQPNKWLIDLGVNDAGSSVSPSTYESNLQTIITDLINNYEANSENIYISRPNYTTTTPYTTVLPTYLPIIDGIISSNNLSTGPDFYTFFSNHYSSYYTDIVHPNAAGFTEIARLNFLSILKPQNVSISQTVGTVTLDWDDLSSTETTINGYKVKYGTSSDNYTTTLDVGNVITKDITGLTDGQTYYFSVSAYDNDSYTVNETSNATELSITYDTSSPAVSGVSQTSSETTTSTIGWVTNENSSSKIDYGLTSSYGSTTSETDTSIRVISHSVTLSGLTSCTAYHYRVRSKDTALNEAVGSDNTFTTSGCTASSSVENSSSEAITTASGGSLSLLDGSSLGLSLTIPASFASSDANFQAHKLDKTTVLASTSTPTGYTAVGDYVYELSALTDVSSKLTSFDNAITVSMSYADSDVSGIDESSLKLYRWDGSSWNQLSGCSVNASANTISCTTTAFSTFALFGQASSSSSTSSSSSSSSSNSPASCDNIPPSSAPLLWGATAKSSNSILLQFGSAGDSFDHFALEYGVEPGIYQWGATNIGSQEIREYEVKSLTPNTTYYFRIRGGNGCAAGDWSEELSTKTWGYVSTGNLEFTSSELTPAEEESSTEDNFCQTYTVESGDTLWSIASDLLGDGARYQEIIDNNKDAYSSLETSSSVDVGWKLKVNCSDSNTSMDKTSEDLEQGGYDVKVSVVDTDKNPIEGAKVTMHSKVQEAITDKDGIARFSNVEPGDHRVIIAYGRYEGEQAINLTGDVKEFALNVTVQEKPFSLSPLAIGLISVLLIVVIILAIKLKRRS